MLRRRALAACTLTALTLVGCGPQYRSRTRRGEPAARAPGGREGKGELDLALTGGGEGAPEGVVDTTRGVVSTTGGVVGGAWSAALATTTAASQLQRITTDPIDEERPALSPDGTTLLVGLRTWTKEGGLRNPGIVAVSPNGGPERQLMTQPGTDADRAAWLPDGSSYVYATSAPGSWSIVRAKSRSPGAPYALVASGDVAPGADYPSVAPDGLVALTVEKNKALFVATVRLDGGGFELVEQGNQPAFSPDGQRLAFVREVDGVSQLFVSRRNGEGVAQLTSGKASVGWPTWSPDGARLAFATNKGTELQPSKDRRSQIWVVRLDGSGATQLTSGTSDCGFPFWGRDGFLYFNSNATGNYDIWRLRPNTNLTGTSL